MSEERFLAAIGRLAMDQQPVQVNIGKFDLWCLLGAVQLACRHPDFIGPSRNLAEKVARDLYFSLTANDRDLQMCASMGWLKQFDEPKDAA
jgi:hypothetical protein